MKVREIMSEAPATVLPGDTIVTAARAMRTADVGLMPVVADAASMRLVGVITDRDITTRCVAENHQGACLVREHMTSPTLHTIGPGDDVTFAARKMRQEQVRRIPVVDEHDRVVGIVSQADLATHARALDVQLLQDTLAAISQPVAIHA